ncbi:hypothetical protein UPYG_G00108280 [Umbra pygmaea]|uniref:Uncharacterized protein n=1 Tax=Umbra pygmaea TaxID=75934 RepID=A0ABD0XS05_UMBPY
MELQQMKTFLLHLRICLPLFNEFWNKVFDYIFTECYEIFKHCTKLLCSSCNSLSDYDLLKC